MTDRVTCIVPGCKRSTQRLHEDHEWVCGKHWPAVPRRWRHLYAKAKRRGRRWLVFKIWQRVKKLAVERAFGIG